MLICMYAGSILVSGQDVQLVVEDLRERLCILGRHSDCFGLSEYMCSEVCRVYDTFVSTSRKTSSSLKAYENLALTMASPYALDSLLDIFVSNITSKLEESSLHVPSAVQAHLTSNPMCKIVEVM